MVALLEKTDNIPKTAHRARGATSSTLAPDQLRSNSANRIEFRRNTYDNRRRLESCSRDPIGYADGGSLYALYIVPSQMDPSGLECDGPYLNLGLGNFWQHIPNGVELTNLWTTPEAVWDVLNWWGSKIYSIGMHGNGETFVKETTSNTSITVENQLSGWSDLKTNKVLANKKQTCTIECVSKLGVLGEECIARAKCPEPDKDIQRAEKIRGIHNFFFPETTFAATVSMKSSNSDGVASVEWNAKQGIVSGGGFE